MVYFMIFAIFLILFIWYLQTFFLNNYYEQMKVQETQRTAALLKSTYQSDPDSFDDLAFNTSATNDVFIRVDTSDGGTSIYDSGSYFKPSNIAFDYETETARTKLESGTSDHVSLITKERQTNTRRLVYAAYLSDSEEDYIFIIAPLYPVQSTITILREQLKVISIIALVVAIVLAMFISTRLSAPLKSLTKSATELSKGNYNAKFSGGMFTETNELARALNKASYEMQKTDSYQRDLIANVSHDLKTPLTMIKSYAEMINDISGDIPEKRAQHLNVIITEADRLNKLVSDMLSASRIQSNSEELEKETFDFVEVASEIADTYILLNEQEGYNINFSKCKPTYVYGDKEKLKQVMSNLISNAVKYCGDDKFVQIEVKRISGKKIRFDVIDHGEGIAADEIGHVWERYYRTSANRNRAIEGSGLGLSIVKGILVLHNANYGVDSKVGQGSDFWFELETVKKDT